MAVHVRTQKTSQIPITSPEYGPSKHCGDIVPLLRLHPHRALARCFACREFDREITVDGANKDSTTIRKETHPEVMHWSPYQHMGRLADRSRKTWEAAMGFGCLRALGVEVCVVIDKSPFAGWRPRISRSIEGETYLHWRRVELIVAFPKRVEQRLARSGRKVRESGETESKGAAGGAQAAVGDPGLSGAGRGHAVAHGGEFSSGGAQ